MDTRQKLMDMGEEEYRIFQCRLIPTVPEETVIGVRTLAKQISASPEAEEFLGSLPHKYHEENCLHAFLIELIKDYGECINRVEAFLPYVDNWAVCDQMSPKVFKKHKDELLERIRLWLDSTHCYTVRFAIGVLMTHFLDTQFRPEYLSLVAGVRSQEYYINMMRAWFFATALAKQYDSAVDILKGGMLDEWTHNKTIQKAVESRRITPQQKQYLKSLRYKRRVRALEEN